MSLVLDASMTIAWLFTDERSEAAAGVLRRVVETGALVPSLWRLEVANVLRNAVKRGRCDEAYVDRSLARLGRLAITVDGQTDEQAWGGTLALGREWGLTVYDAVYLELAVRSRRALATFDAGLMAAAERANVELIT